MIQFNELKANARNLFDIFKKVMDYENAMDQAIKTVCRPFSFESILLTGKAFSSMKEVEDYIRTQLIEDVNLIVEDSEHYSLTNSDNHFDWYRPKKANDEINFKFWNRYKKYLTHIKGWAESSVEKIDIISDEILNDIEDPTVPNRAFDRRGLVVGYVQSGKTANFMGTLNKAIDSGYRIIIVLAGMQESLRQQTQERIDEEILGIDTNPEEAQKRIGVSTLPGESYVPIDYFTESNLKPNKSGDFNIKKSRGTPPSLDRPIIFVVKKNKSILENLRKYFEHWINIFDDDLTYQDGESKKFNNLPLLIIDDESDQASINTKAPVNTDGDELDPTAINHCIRKILNLFRQKVYIGYTATPFANIFIEHNTAHSRLGKDLFPSAFIKTLGSPSNYLGPREVFGLNNDVDNGLPIYREVNDSGQFLKDNSSTFMPLGHKPDYIPVNISGSLKKALKSFLISSAIRWSRGQENKHNTMLVHCTRYNAVQLALADLIDYEMEGIRNAINDSGVLLDLKRIFDLDFIKTSHLMGNAPILWDDLVPYFSKVVKKLEPKCRIINGTVGDILDYKNKERTGLWSIAIGGDKLSRGLTLEGLTVSYFTRSTSLYDTLMQMGRWFGYRNGFEDLCRIYTTQELFSWYRHISTAFESLREEFIEMSRLGLKPIDFGLRVQDHPAMMVTSVMKMRATDKLRLNYQGTITETSTLPANESVLKLNYEAAESFVKSLGQPHQFYKPNNVWFDVPVNIIQNFLKDYQTFKGLPAANSIRINQYIELQRIKNDPEYLEWNVSVFSLKSLQEKQVKFAGFTVNAISRAINLKGPDSYFIKRLISANDELVDFTDDQKRYIHDNKLSKQEIRSFGPRKKNPLLTIYILDLKESDQDFEFPPIGFAISWPVSASAEPMYYVTNSVYSELELNEYD